MKTRKPTDLVRLAHQTERIGRKRSEFDALVAALRVAGLRIYRVQDDDYVSDAEWRRCLGAVATEVQS